MKIFTARLTGKIIKRLRSEAKFNGLDALKAQLAQDKADALKIIHPLK